MSATQKVVAALHLTQELSPDYLRQTLLTRTDTTGVGSVYPGYTPEELFQALLEKTWEPYANELIQKPAEGFLTTLPGLVGVVRIERLEEFDPVYLIYPKECGSLSVGVYGKSGQESLETVMMLGPNSEQDSRLVMWTFHPLPVLSPSQFMLTEENLSLLSHDGEVALKAAREFLDASEPERVGKMIPITHDTAKRLGFDWAKIIQ